MLKCILVDTKFVHFFNLRIKERVYCMERWNLDNGRLFYSVFIFLLQLILPTFILIFAHARIYQKLVSSKFFLRRRKMSSPELGKEN